MIYDFGCGQNKVLGSIGVDIMHGPDVDIVCDITIDNAQLPSNSARLVYCRHCLEHIPYPDHLAAFGQILRVLEVGGVFEILVPHPGHDCAMVPDHKHWFTQQYVNDVLAKFPGVRIDRVVNVKTPLFDIVKMNTQYSDELIFSLFRNVASELLIVGTKI